MGVAIAVSLAFTAEGRKIMFQRLQYAHSWTMNHRYGDETQSRIRKRTTGKRQKKGSRLDVTLIMAPIEIRGCHG